MKQEHLSNPLPSSPEAEQICLGAVLLDPEIMAINLSYFGPDDLYNPRHRVVYEAMIALFNSGKIIDPVQIVEEIKKHGSNTIDSLGGMSSITNLTLGLPHFTPETIIANARTIRKHSITRSAIRICNRVTQDLLEPDLDPEEVLAKLETKSIQLSNAILSGTTGSREDPFLDTIQIVPDMRERFERMHNGEVTGTSTGMEELDHILDGGGLQKKGTYLIGGREKSGKTSLALGWLAEVAIHQDQTAMMITLEMSRTILMQRLYAAHMGIPYYMFRPGFYDSEYDDPYTRAMEGLDEFGTYPFKIADSLFDWASIKRYCTRTVEQCHKPGQKPVGIIVVDYMQLIHVAGASGNREREVAEISRGLKQLSSELDVPIVVMSNLNRIGEQDNLEPDTLNLRESGQLAYDAEGIFFVHNPAYKYGQPYTPRDITDITLILARQRNGPPGRFNLKFIGKYMQFMTETQYLKHFGNQGVDRNVPETLGQDFEQNKKRDTLWDEDDDGMDNFFGGKQ